MMLQGRNHMFVCALYLVFSVAVWSAEFLPYGWSAYTSNGQTYYYNQKTGISQWELPIPSQTINPVGNARVGQSQRPSTVGVDSRTAFSTTQNPAIGSTQHEVPLTHQQLQQQTPRDNVETVQQQSPISSIDTRSVKQHNSTNTTETHSGSHKPIQLDTTNDVPIGQSLNSNVSVRDAPTTAKTVSSSTAHDVSVTKSLAGGVQSNGGPRSTNDSAAARSNKRSLESELLEADNQVKELKEIISELGVERTELLEKLKLGEQALSNFTSISAAATFQEKEVNEKEKADLKSRISSLETRLDTVNSELEDIKDSRDRLTAELAELETLSSAAKAELFQLKPNFTIQINDLKLSQSRIAEQEKELADARKEIVQLNEDLRNVAEPRLRRLRQPSFFSRMLQSAFPIWTSKSNPKPKKGKSKNTPATDLAETMSSLNRTVDTLRENLTAMAAALEGKEEVIVELTEQLAERVEEAEKRRVAYTALKEGVESGQESNEKLEEDLVSRDIEIESLEEKLVAATVVVEAAVSQLVASETALSSCEERLQRCYAAHASSLGGVQALLRDARGKCDAKEVVVQGMRASLEEAKKAEMTLRGQVSSMAQQLDDLLKQEQIELESRNSAELLSRSQHKKRPWFLFFWPF